MKEILRRYADGGPPVSKLLSKGLRAGSKVLGPVGTALDAGIQGKQIYDYNKDLNDVHNKGYFHKDSNEDKSSYLKRIGLSLLDPAPLSTMAAIGGFTSPINMDAASLVNKTNRIVKENKILKDAGKERSWYDIGKQWLFTQ
jgi:hypothetical protein